MKEFVIKAFTVNRKETIRYLLVGVLTSCVNLGVFFGLSEYLHVNYLIANIGAWVLTVIAGYIANKEFVFDSEHPTFAQTMREFLRFAYGRLLSFFVEMALMYVLVSVFFFGSGYVKIFTSVVVVILNYIISKRFVFKMPKKRKKA